VYLYKEGDVRKEVIKERMGHVFIENVYTDKAKAQLRDHMLKDGLEWQSRIGSQAMRMKIIDREVSLECKGEFLMEEGSL